MGKNIAFIYNKYAFTLICLEKAMATLQYSRLENPMDGGGCTESDTTEVT